MNFGIHDSVEVSGNVGGAEGVENFTLVVHLLDGLPPAHVKGKHSKHELLLAFHVHRSHAGEFHSQTGVVNLCYFQVLANSVRGRCFVYDILRWKRDQVIALRSLHALILMELVDEFLRLQEELVKLLADFVGLVLGYMAKDAGLLHIIDCLVRPFLAKLCVTERIGVLNLAFKALKLSGIKTVCHSCFGFDTDYNLDEPIPFYTSLNRMDKQY